jgi:hypothetical protein
VDIVIAKEGVEKGGFDVAFSTALSNFLSFTTLP